MTLSGAPNAVIAKEETEGKLQMLLSPGVFPLFLPLAIAAFGGPEGYLSLAIIAFGAFQLIVPNTTIA